MLLGGLSPEDRAILQRDGRLERPSQYSPEPSVFTWKLIEEGRNHLLLDKPLALPCPVRLLHGQSPWLALGSTGRFDWQGFLKGAGALLAVMILGHAEHAGFRTPRRDRERHCASGDW